MSRGEDSLTHRNGEKSPGKQIWRRASSAEKGGAEGDT